MSEVDLWAERRRIAEQGRGERPWSLWGPYLSERQWGTVREDYSRDGNAWRSLTHDEARSRAYRWGEDGLAGLSDDSGLMCLSLALWNGQDRILKERLFGVTNEEGNHGEDVKEVYHYLDAVPSHAYLKFLYRYPHAAFPYNDLLRESLRRGRGEPEYEIGETGVFEDGRYCDVAVEYAKQDVDDIHVVITATNRGREPADLHVIPQLWFRNTWAWKENDGQERPWMAIRPDGSVATQHPRLGPYRLSGSGAPDILFCENETNLRLHGGHPDAPGPFKDGLHAAIVEGDRAAVSTISGTKVGLHYTLRLAAGEAATIRLRLCAGTRTCPVDGEGAVTGRRIAEADAFYDALQDGIEDADRRNIFRQAAAGLIWTKQLYRYDVRQWLRGDPTQSDPPPERRSARNATWGHFNGGDVLSMPDKWEYPWFAAWDLAFHCLPLALLDPDFAKNQLLLLTREWYMHPNGQLPAYEWEFGDTNPPVHAWATFRVFEIDRDRRGGRGDLAFLEGVFHKLLINFTWWVNRKDANGRNVFQGGFLGLDNVGVFDRSRPPPGFGVVHQADGTAWMAMYALNMMRIALELARHNDVYESTASKFFEHFLYIAEAMTDMGGEGFGLWDEQDQFYYDEVDMPDGRMIPLRARSMVGLVPLFAVEVIDPVLLQRLPDFARRMNWVLENRPHLARLVSRWTEGGVGDRKLLSLLRGHRMKALLHRMLDEAEFLSDYGVRSLSKAHQEHPYSLNELGASFTVKYDPADSTSNMFGGNSNWRGPVWMPMNYLIIEALRRFHAYYGDDFLVEYPTGSGTSLTLSAIADALEDRLIALFTKDADGRRPFHGREPQAPCPEGGPDPLLFHEFFDGDTGRGLGASHQTGWTALILNLLHNHARRPADTPDRASGGGMWFKSPAPARTEPQPMAQSPLVTPEWLHQRLDTPDLVVLDASWYLPAAGRDPEAEFVAAHIPGAVRFDLDAMSDETSPLPHMMPRPEVFASRMRALGIGDGAQIVVYDGMGLFSAPRVWWMLRTFGKRDVHVLDGGLPAWVAAGFPMEDGEPRQRDRRHFTARLDNGAVADAGDIARALDTGSAQVVDARSGSRFRGEEAEPRPGVRPGHMPGALNMHYSALQQDGRMKDPEALEAVFAQNGIDPERPILTTCGSGVTAAIVSLALETMGRPAHALYDGSWSEWGADETRPVATGNESGGG